MKKTLLLFLSLIAYTSYAQSNFWTKQDNKRNDAFLNRSQPRNHTVFSLDFQALKQQLNAAPKRGDLTAKNNLILTFPTVNGKMEKYSIIEASVLHPQLATKYPGIKSFAGKGIDNPAATIRFSISDQQGMHAMIMNGHKGTSFIDPADKNTYVIYARKDLSKRQEFVCYTEGNKLVEKGIFEGNINYRATNDSKLRKYRLALSCTAEYGNKFAGEGTDAEKRASVLAQMNVTMTRVNGVYERDFAITMELVPNTDELIYFGNTNEDPWSNEWNTTTQTLIDNVIGDANYDIGHNFTVRDLDGNAGCIGCVCTSGSKGSAYTGLLEPSGDPFDIDFVSHEMGHQFGAYHTMNVCSRSGSGTSDVEPGSGSTIMGYAGICEPNVQNNSDAYFAYVNIKEVSENIQSGESSGCAEIIELNNSAPTANAGDDFTIPALTPFVLTGEGFDVDGDVLTYTWEQNDPERAPGSGVPDPIWTQGPLFRSIEGTTSPSRYMPNLNDVIAGNLSPTWEVLPSVSRTMEFALTVRDNAAGGGQTADDLMTVTVEGNAGPFLVLDPVASTNWYDGQSQTILWNVANTDIAPINCSNVKISLSTDGGLTFPIVLAESTANDGEVEVIVPSNLSGTCRIKIESIGNIFYAMSSGDFTINEAVACNLVVPTGLTANAITSNSAILSWDENTGATYGINYRKAGDTEWIATSAGGATRQLLNLEQLTEYEVQVRSKCGTETSDFSSTYTFTTAEQEIEYCNSNGESTSDEYIGRVQLGTIDNTSNEGTNGYSDFTNLSTELNVDENYTITVTPEWTGTTYDEAYAVFIDFNQDGDFDDSNEIVWTKEASETTPVSGTFTIPATALTGFTRMRVSMRYSTIPSSCGSFSYGEVEDYTVNIVSTGISSVYFVSSNIDKTVANIGDRVTLSFNASQEINTPTIMIAGHDITPTSDGNSWKAEYIMTADDIEGQIPFLISNLSTVGRETYEDVSTTSDGKYVTFVADETIPTIDSVSIYSDNDPNHVASVGDKVVLNLMASEEISAPTVEIAGNTYTAEGSGTDWYVAFILTGNEPEGLITFSISNYQDISGNAGSNVAATTDGSSVMIDKTAPTINTISIFSDNSRNELAKVGDKVTLTFIASEDLKEPTVNIGGNKVSVVYNDGSWTAEYTLTNLDNEGEMILQISAVSDLAGNAGNTHTATTDGSGVTFDKTSPELTDVTLTTENINTQYLSIGNEMTVTFTANEGIDNVTVDILTHTVNATNTSENNWLAAYTLTANDPIDKNLNFSIHFSDLAGNEGVSISETTDNTSLITGLFETNRLSLDVFPSPTSDELNITLPKNVEIESISVFDITGKNISVSKDGKIHGNFMKLDVSGLNKGMYFIQMTDGKSYYSSKFIKE